MIPEMPMFAPSMLDALDLTEAQGQQIEGVKKALTPEFEKTLEEIAVARGILMSKGLEAYRKHGVILGGDQMGIPIPPEKMEAIQNTLKADGDFQRLQEEIARKAENFSSQFKVQLFDVLTDEQWIKFQNLVDNPPEYVKAWLKVYSSRNARQEEKREVWMPGPNSWQPGDPIPGAYRQERNTRGSFPRQD